MRYFILFYLVLFCLRLFGHDTPIDSFALLPDTASVKDRIALVDRIGKFFQTIKNEEVKKSLVQQYFQIATTRKDSLFLAQGNFLQGDYQNQKEVLRRYGMHLDDHSDDQSIYSTLNIYHDKKGSTSFEEIRNNGQLFENNNTLEKYANYNPKEVYWAKAIFYGDSEKTDEYLFDFSPNIFSSSWSKIDVWLVHENDSITYYQTGDQFEASDKPIPSKQNLLRFEVQQNERVQLYFRMQDVHDEKHGKPNQIKIHIINEDNFPGFFPGYPFKGRYASNRAAFSTNIITQHDLYVDSTGTATIDDIVNQQKILPWTDAPKIKHQVNTAYWMRARFYGSPYFNGEQILHISTLSGMDAFSFDFVDSYVSDGHGGYHHQRTGDHVPLKERPYEHWASFIQLDIGLTDTLDVFIQMKGADSQRLIPQGADMGLYLYHVDLFSLFPSQSNYAMFNGLIFGVLGIQSLFFFLLFLIEREKIHLYFSLIVLGIFLTQGFDGINYNKYVLFPLLLDHSSSFYFFGLFLLSTCSLKFVEAYFSYPKSSFFSKWLIPTYTVLLAIVLLNAAIQFEYINIENNIVVYFSEEGSFDLVMLFSLILILTLIFCIVKAPPQNKASKVFFLLAFTPLLLNTLVLLITIFIFSETHTVEWQEFLVKGINISMLATVTLIALSIGYRTNRLKADKAIAEQKNIFDQKEKDNAVKIKRAAIELEKTNGLLEIQNAKNEVLLKEIHHRVKNNLQTISSLLSLQSNTIKDQGALDAVQESQNRVASMALIHQKLYQGENLAAIEMRDYFETIGNEILSSFGDKAKGVELNVSMSEIELDVDTAIPIGLITNELITNSLKYAFNQKDNGKISITMNKDENNLIQLKIADNGTNQSAGMREGGAGFGTMLVNLLTTQLGGQLEQSIEQGTATIIKFNLNKTAA